MPGIWGHQLTFFAGSRVCIGYRFAIVEYVLASQLGYANSDTQTSIKDEGTLIHFDQSLSF